MAQRWDVAGTDWLAEINKYRAAAGLSFVSNEPTWDEGIQNHLVYLERTPSQYFTGQYESWHTENPSSPYYTSSGDQEAGFSDLAAGGGATPVGAIDLWLAGPFHAVGMLRAQLTRVAFANDPATGYAGLDVLQGLDSSQPPASVPVLFPGPGVTTNISRYPGGEMPDPLETCGWSGRPGVGTPLIALLTGAPAAGLAAELQEPDGTTVSTANGHLCVVDQNTYTSSDSVYGPSGEMELQQDRAVFLIPDAPLHNGTYLATIRQPGQADISWSFSTFVPPPQLVEPPSIAGSPTPRGLMYALPGSWTGEPTSFEYQWMLCDSTGAGCVPILDATADHYTVAESDLGHTLRLREVASNDGGPGSPAISAPSPLIAQAPAYGLGSYSYGAPGSRTVGATSLGKPGRPGYRRRGSRIVIYWLSVHGARRYRVRLTWHRHVRVITTSAHRVVVRVSARYRARVTMRAVGAGGTTSAASKPVSIAAAK